ncbi:MAG: type II toxin-antitoxin system RelE/ParE family toxin [Betaproteobacteria bacterium]
MPAVRVEFHPAAIAEANAAFAWYADRDETAAALFLAELDRVSDLIAVDPERWVPHLFGTRRIVLRRFPFSAVFRATCEVAVVFAVVHHRRRPGYWKDRLRPVS